MEAPPIPFSRTDLERQRLESTLDHDLSSLSLTLSNTAASSSFASQSSVSTLGVARSAPVIDYRPNFDTTPRPGARNPSFATSFASAGVGLSPASTAGHHVSEATIGAGVFNTRRSVPDRTNEEFDPDRSLGRLVGELAKAMGDDRINKPSSSFRSHSPRSPSPPQQPLPNLSFSLSRIDPLPSPPASRTVSAASSKSSGSGSGRTTNNDHAQSQQTRRPLGDTARHNVKNPNPIIVPHVIPPKRTSRLDETSDITGMTGLLATPAKGTQFENLDKNAAPETAGANVPSTLSLLHAHIRALQNEKGVANHRIRELEEECQHARDEVKDMQRKADQRLSEVLGEKAALEELVKSLREHLARLTAELEAQKAIIAELRRTEDKDAGVRSELGDIKRDIERLTREVARLNEVAAQGLLARSVAREHRSMRVDALDVDEDEVDRIGRDVSRREQRSAATQTDLPSQFRQGLHAAGAPEVGLMPPSAKAVRVASSESEGEGDGIASPTPSSRRPASRQSRHSSVSPPSPPPPLQDAFFPARQPESERLSPAAQRHAERAERGHQERTRNEHTRHDRTGRSERERRVRHERTAEGDTTPSQHSVSSTRSRRSEGPMSPFPSIRAEDEVEFFSPHPSPRVSPAVSRKSTGRSRLARSTAPLPSSHNSHERHSAPPPGATSTHRTSSGLSVKAGASTGAPTVRAILDGQAEVPPATVLARVIVELEADFAHYKTIYVELADQYKVLDPASAVAKRHVLAAHLKEVIDCLEQKADQVAALYSLMNVEDRPASSSTAEPRPMRSVRDLWRGVRDVLGEDAVRRLEEDGLFRH